MNVTNLQAAKDLVKRYRSITREELAEVSGGISAITGFGSIADCTLCKTAKSGCRSCIHAVTSTDPEVPCIKQRTYYSLSTVVRIPDVLDAIKDRADYLEELIHSIEEMED